MEQREEYITDALEMIGKGYNLDPVETKFISTISGFTPVPDAISMDCGPVTALVWGRVWRYCQMADGVCRASLSKIADGIGMSERTVIRHLEVLCDSGYLLDTTPELRNKPHIYADTGKIRIRFSGEATMTQSQRAMTQSQRQGDRESVEESIKKESKNNASLSFEELAEANKKVDAILAMRDAPGIKREAKIDAILSYIGGKLQINTETARWKKFAKFAYNKHLEGEQIETFISWVTSQKNFDVQFWPPQKMEEMWPQAFGEKKPAEKPSMFRTINS